MFGLVDLGYLGLGLVVVWGMYEYLPHAIQRLVRATAPRQIVNNGADIAWDAAPPNSEPVPREAPLNPAPAAAQPGAFSTEQWRDALNDSPHLLIYGPSKAGKSTLAQAIVAMFDGCEYVVIDPMPNKPGEQKWGGIDFVTLDETGTDEYASIKAAFAAIQAEDQRRRKAMRTEIARPLVVIVDEVLQLVDALGTVKTPDGKTEPRMTQFMRAMGATARHRNIKIILLGQGKNLADLGLSSSTARNNYALIRVARDNATNERSAWIDAGGREQAMDIRYVPILAQRAAQRARLWLSHDALACTPDTDALLSMLFNGDNAEPVTENTGERLLSPVLTGSEPAELVDDEMIIALHQAGWSRNKIAAKMTTGNKQQRLDRIRVVLGPAIP